MSHEDRKREWCRGSVTSLGKTLHASSVTDERLQYKWFVDGKS